MDNKLKVKLADGKQVEIKRQGFVVKIWNAGKWNNMAAFEPEDYNAAERCYEEYKNKGWNYVEIDQLF